MRYFELLNLRREPFSNSPDPDLFYRAKQHRECLQNLEVALRLKRGLCVVTGHVGTGKTTLCRQLIRVLGERQGVVTHLILDPSYTDAREFLAHLNELFGGDRREIQAESDWQLRENIKSALFRLAVEEDRLVVLIVDEGQKISLECLEILRELLNYETNEHKLLQIVIFGQLEFEPILEAKANLADRVNLRFRLGPLDFQDTRELIQARLAMCSKDISPEGLFSFWALLGVYLATDGFPRQIVQLCHQALLAVIIKERPRVTWGVVRSCMRWRTLGLPRRRRWPRLAATGLALALFLAVPAFYLRSYPQDAARLNSWVQVQTSGLSGWYASLKSRFSSNSPVAGKSSVGDSASSVPPEAKAPSPQRSDSKGVEQAAPGQASSQAKPPVGREAAASGAPQAGTEPPVNGLPAPSAPGGPAQAEASKTLGQSTAASASKDGLPGQMTPGKDAGSPSPQGVPQPGKAPAGVPSSVTGQSAQAVSNPSVPGQSATAGRDDGSTASIAKASPSAPGTPQPSSPESASAQPPVSGSPAAVEASDEQSAPEQVPAPSEAKTGPPRFTGLLNSLQGEAESLDILTDQQVARYEVSFKDHPPRIVVDLMGLWERRTERELPVGSPHIDKVRSAVHPDKLRVAIYLRDAPAGNVQPEVEKTPTGLRVILK